MAVWALMRLVPTQIKHIATARMSAENDPDVLSEWEKAISRAA
jgi:hypothetical protein